jgi:hypothetical protein
MVTASRKRPARQSRPPATDWARGRVINAFREGRWKSNTNTGWNYDENDEWQEK